jgi:flagellar hook-associated protein 2
LKSDLLSLSSSLGSLVEGTDLLPQPTVTNSTVATASLPSGSAGSASSYTLEVTKLAAAQVVATGNLSTSATMKGGTLTFNFGTISGNALTSNGTSKAITIADGATLSQVATAINSASMGVTAYVATNANGQQLIIKGSEGASNGFSITSSDDAAATASNSSLSALAYNPASSSNGSSLIASSSDAAYKLDGISRTSTSNTIAYAAPGLALKLTGTNSGSATTITFSDPSSSIKTTMSNLVTAFNSIVSEINTDTTAATGNLYNDTGAKAAKRAFAALANTVIMPNAADGEPKTLGDLGLTLSKDGTYTLDSAVLSAALSKNSTAVAAMFTSGVHGVYSTVFSMVNSLTTSTNSGSLAGSVTQYTELQTRLTDKQTTMATLQSQLRTRLIAQYAAANSSVASSNSTLTYLTNQIAAWNKTG